jgi:probable HAF family extracellular repeat protein
MNAFTRAVCGLACTCAGASLAHAAAPSLTAVGHLASPGVETKAWNISADGSTVVGQSYTTTGLDAFRWTAAGGIVAIGNLPGSASEYGIANGVNADGSVIAGVGTTSTGAQHAFRYTAGTGAVDLGELAGGGELSVGDGLSADGSTVVGHSQSASGQEAFRWTAAGMVGLGDLPGGSFQSVALATSSDGAVTARRGTPTTG